MGIPNVRMSVQPAGGDIVSMRIQQKNIVGLDWRVWMGFSVQSRYMTVISPDISQKLCNSVGFSAGNS